MVWLLDPVGERPTKLELHGVPPSPQGTDLSYLATSRTPPSLAAKQSTTKQKPYQADGQTGGKCSDGLRAAGKR